MIEVIIGEIAGALAFSISSIIWGTLHYADRMHKREHPPVPLIPSDPTPGVIHQPILVNHVLEALIAERAMLSEKLRSDSDIGSGVRAVYLKRLREVVKEIEEEQGKCEVCGRECNDTDHICEICRTQYRKSVQP